MLDIIVDKNFKKVLTNKIAYRIMYLSFGDKTTKGNYYEYLVQRRFK